MNLKVNKIVESYKNSNMNKELLSYKLKSYYNLNENERKHILYYIQKYASNQTKQ